ncbi:MAG TPA: hypothetical protein VI522_03375, partial [Gammaproteobacteria bacterium]|nr:hypothetical protein [Gammaproteobacteria bacterium]
SQTSSKQYNSLATKIAAEKSVALFDFSGSWSKIGIYTDGVLDENNAIDFHYIDQFKQDTINNMSVALNACLNKDHCISDYYTDMDKATQDFVASSGKSPFIIGYFEAIFHSFFKQNLQEHDKHIDTLKLSIQDNVPLLFVDAWVKSKKCADTACEQAADAFSHYISDKVTQSWIISSQDLRTDELPPRFLIPSNTDSLSQLDNKLNPVKEAYELIRDGLALPKEVGYQLNVEKKYYSCMISSELGLVDPSTCAQYPHTTPLHITLNRNRHTLNAEVRPNVLNPTLTHAVRPLTFGTQPIEINAGASEPVTTDTRPVESLAEPVAPAQATTSTHLNYYVTKLTPAFSVGFVDGLTEIFAARMGNSYLKHLNKVAIVGAMYVAGYSLTDTFILTSFELVLQQAGMSSQKAKIASFSLITLLHLVDANRMLLLTELILGVMANTAGRYVGHQAAHLLRWSMQPKQSRDTANRAESLTPPSITPNTSVRAGNA